MDDPIPEIEHLVKQYRAKIVERELSESVTGPEGGTKNVTLPLDTLTHIHLDADQGEAVGSCGATLEVFFEVLRPEPRLIIAGAGYVAQTLARLAAALDFRIVVVDDRRDLADPIAFDDKVQLTFGDIPQTIHDLEPDDHQRLSHPLPQLRHRFEAARLAGVHRAVDEQVGRPAQRQQPLPG